MTEDKIGVMVDEGKEGRKTRDAFDTSARSKRSAASPYRIGAWLCYIEYDMYPSGPVTPCVLQPRYIK